MNRGPNDPYRFDENELDPALADGLLRKEIFTFSGQDYEYGVIDTSKFPIHFAAGMNNGQNLFISSKVPADLLSYYLEHEIRCNRLEAEKVGRCAKIEEQMLRDASPKLVQSLLQARRRTLEDLISFFKVDLENPSDPFRKEIAGTTSFLREHMKKLGIQLELPDKEAEK